MVLAFVISLIIPASNAQSPTGGSAKGGQRGAGKPKSISLDFVLSDADGRTRTAKEWRSARAVALFFLATECPISNRYAPEINRLVSDFEGRGILFYGVHSDPSIDAAAVRQHARDYGFSFPVLMDPTQTLAGRAEVELTPTAVILSPAGELLYRGRIDNRYLDFGKYRDADIKPDLRLALDAVVAGKPVAEPFTKPIGCALPPPGESETRRHER
jgi:peroxiredoxin